MTVELSRQQQDALDQAPKDPIRVIDPRNSAAYVLLPAQDYESIREVIEDNKLQRAVRNAAIRNAVGRGDDQP